MFDYIRNFFVNLGTSWTNWLNSFLPEPAVTVVNFLVIGIILVMMPVIATLTLTWMERKVIGRIQNRIGPNRVGPWGIFQAIADAVKMLVKEDIVPDGADRPVFNLAPILIAAGAALLWAVIPFGRGMVGADLNIGVIYLVAVGSITTVAVIMAGWASNNKFALIGAFRVVAQLLSYEVPMILSIAAVALIAGTMSTMGVVEAQQVPFALLMPVAFIAYFVAGSAEVGRAPFDLLEADSEIVAGYFVEYSGLKFGWFYIAEYGNLFAISAIATTLFLGGWRGPFSHEVPALGPLYFIIKTILVVFLLMWIRGTWPRFRIDQMLGFAWKVLVPATLANLLWVAVILKLPVPQLVQWVLMLGGNLLIIFIAATMLGRAAKRYAEAHNLNPASSAV
ncbi:MAG: NADH-quinone oxidoreductase subunit NuoH [Anaerolineae bacterium]|jgi:NADH-quinone oxidoreductase subunit H|nr:NADH-quinone oxidoreductase subunit NuoH [Anaerolineae bacterium]